MLSIAKSSGRNKKKKKYLFSSPMFMGKKPQTYTHIKLYDAI